MKKIYKTLIHEDYIPKGSRVEIYKEGINTNFYILEGTIKSIASLWDSRVVSYRPREIREVMPKNIVGGHLLTEESLDKLGKQGLLL